MRPLRASLALSLSAVLAAASARAQPSAQGEAWRVTRDRVEYNVAEWGSGCGPRPEDRSNTTGREVTVRAVGGELEFVSGGRRQRTDQCWSENRHTEPLAHTRVGNTWNVSCSTPAGESLGESGTYTVTLDGERITVRGETRYAWSLQGSTCRATATLSRAYERVSGAAPTPPPPAPTPPPTPTPPPAVVRPTPTPRPPTPAPARCTPSGGAVALVVSPSRRSTTSGGRVCFRARLVDAARCEMPTRDVAWSVRRASGGGEGAMDRSCFVSTQGGATGLFEVTASAGALSDRAEVEVVTQDRYAALVAERLEDPDGGAPETSSGAQVGGGAVTTEEPQDRTALLLALGGVAALLALVALLVQRRRSAAPIVLDDDDLAARPRREVMPPPEYASAHTPTEPPPNVRRAPPPEPVPEPVIEPVPEVPAVTAAPVLAAQRPPQLRHCPYCRKTFTDELSFCPDDGQPLAPGAPRASAPPPKDAIVMRCPTCGREGVGSESFCPVDGARMVPAVRGAEEPREASPAERRCPKCGRRYPGYMDFCGEDGAALEAM